MGQPRFNLLFIKQRIKQYFIDNNIEIFVLELAQKNQCAIMHQDILRAISALVEKQLPDEIVTEIDTFGKNLQNKFLENFSKAPSWELFHPTLEITKQTIASFDWYISFIFSFFFLTLILTSF